MAPRSKSIFRGKLPSGSLANFPYNFNCLSNNNVDILLALAVALISVLLTREKYAGWILYTRRKHFAWKLSSLSLSAFYARLHPVKKFRKYASVQHLCLVLVVEICMVPDCADYFECPLCFSQPARELCSQVPVDT